MKPVFFALAAFVSVIQAFASDEDVNQGHPIEEFESDATFRTPDEDWSTVYGNADLVVKSIRFAKRNGEFGGVSQFVTVMVQNIGRQFVRNPASKINIKGQLYSASVYGPGQVAGQFLLGAPIYPGQQGQLLVYLPDRTIKHCERLAGNIDAERRLQYGQPDPFRNDGLAGVMAVDTQSIRACVSDTIGR